jgi:hypothetical protein
MREADGTQLLGAICLHALSVERLINASDVRFAVIQLAVLALTSRSTQYMKEVREEPRKIKIKTLHLLILMKVLLPAEFTVLMAGLVIFGSCVH